MNCPYCNTPNDPNNQFCFSCGRTLSGGGDPPSLNRTSSREHMMILTGRLLISLLGLWLLNSILSSLKFVNDLVIPDIGISPNRIISLIIFITAAGLLIGYLRTLSIMWPMSFPAYAEMVVVFNTLGVLLLLSMTYKALSPLILTYTSDADFLMIFQTALLFIAIIVSIRVSIIIYQVIPSWLSRIRLVPYNLIIKDTKTDSNKEF